MIKNKLLIRQLKKANISNSGHICPENFDKLLALVETAYEDMDNNVYRLERTLEVSLSELKSLNSNLENKIEIEVEKNRKKDEKLFNQSRSASMGEMIANIAHQWRQPLSAISTTATSMLLQLELGIAKNDEVRESYDHIIEYTSFLSQTIDDFRGFLNVDEEADAFEIKTIIDKTKNIIKSVYTQNHITIIYEKPEGDFTVKGMPNALAQVFLNILNNSKDAFITHNVEDKKVFINLEIENGTYVIYIKDTALGIDEEIISKIFDPYFTTKHQSQGTGIGLHMSRNIIERTFDGSIDVSNVKFDYDDVTYQGACFKISIPLLIEEL
mgnify:CR=1 FL=1